MNTNASDHPELPTDLEWSELPFIGFKALWSPSQRAFFPDPTQIRWTGEYVGQYLRNSTHKQVDKDRVIYQAASIKWLILSRGMAVKVYEEQGISGGRLISRKKILAMLDALDRDEIDHISVSDVGRLTRDERGIDGAEIGERLKAAAMRRPGRAGKLFLPPYGLELDLRDEFTYQSYQQQYQQAGFYKVITRRQTYQGIKVAAQRRPMVRKSRLLGYYRVPELDAEGKVMTNSSGSPKMAPRKADGASQPDGSHAPDWRRTMTAIIEALCTHEIDDAPTLRDVCADLRRDGVPSPFRRKAGYATRNEELVEEGGRIQYWVPEHLASAMMDPLFHGHPGLVTGNFPPGQVWAGFQIMDEGFHPYLSTMHDRPELAWWSQQDAQRWAKAYGIVAEQDDRGRPRYRFRRKQTRRVSHEGKVTYSFIGILRCWSCGQEMIKSTQGRCQGGRYDQTCSVPVYACPWRMNVSDAQPCDQPQTVRESVVWAAVDDLVILRLFEHLPPLQAAIENRIAQLHTKPATSEAELQIRAIDKRLRRLTAGAANPDDDDELDGETVAELRLLRGERRTLVLELRRDQTRAGEHTVDEPTLKRVLAISARPYESFRNAETAERAAVVRALVDGIAVSAPHATGVSPARGMIVPIAEVKVWSPLLSDCMVWSGQRLHAEDVRSARLFMGMGYGAFAKYLGTRQAMVWGWENTDRVLTAATPTLKIREILARRQAEGWSQPSVSGAEFREALDHLGLNYKQAAAYFGCSSPTIRRWVREDFQPMKPEMVAKVRAAILELRGNMSIRTSADTSNACASRAEISSGWVPGVPSLSTRLLERLARAACHLKVAA